MSHKKRENPFVKFLKRYGLVAIIVTAIITPLFQNAFSLITGIIENCLGKKPYILSETVCPYAGLFDSNDVNNDTTDSIYTYGCTLDVFLESTKPGNKRITDAVLCVDAIEEFYVYDVIFESSAWSGSPELRAYIINNCQAELEHCYVEMTGYVYDPETFEEYAIDLTDCFGLTGEEGIAQDFNLSAGDGISYTVLNGKEDYLLDLCKEYTELYLYATVTFDNGIQSGGIGTLYCEEDNTLAFVVTGDGETLTHATVVSVENGVDQEYPLISTSTGDRIVGASFEHDIELIVNILADRTCKLTFHIEYTVGDTALSTEEYEVYIYCPIYNHLSLISYMANNNMITIQNSKNLPEDVFYSPYQHIEKGYSE